VPLPSDLVGRPLVPIAQHVEGRWIAAYNSVAGAEALGEHAHPVFPVAPEWELVVRSLAQATPELTAAERSRGLHVAHDVEWLAPLRPGAHFDVEGWVEAVARHRAGALLTLRLTGSAERQAIWSTAMTVLLPAVEVVGEDRPGAPLPTVLGETSHRSALHVRGDDAHAYSEGARIWNPIHTDVGAARAAGLEAPVLHGTATLARAVSLAVDAVGRSLTDVRRVAGRFAGAVRLPSRLEVQIVNQGAVLGLHVRDAEGRAVLSDGLVAFRPVG